MSDLFPLSVILHFPPEVYLSRGVGDLCPLLVRAWHVRKISALQFLRGGRVRVTVREPAFREELLSSDFVFEGRKIPVTPAGVHTTTVYVRDLPVELSDESVKSALSVYGDVYSVRHAYFKDFPELRNGNRLLLMSVSTPIPSSLNVLGFVCRTWYSGQPVRCSICKEPDHLPQTCPLSGLCRRCKQPGHVARECARAWGASRPPSSASVPSPVPPSVLSSPVPASNVKSPAPNVKSPVPVPSSPVKSPVPVPSSPVPVSSPSKSPVPNVPCMIPVNDENWNKVRSLLEAELSKIPPCEVINFQSFVGKFMASFSVPDHYRPPIFQVLQSFVRKRRSREW